MWNTRREKHLPGHNTVDPFAHRSLDGVEGPSLDGTGEQQFELGKGWWCHRGSGWVATSHGKYAMFLCD